MRIKNKIQTVIDLSAAVQDALNQPPLEDLIIRLAALELAMDDLADKTSIAKKEPLALELARKAREIRMEKNWGIGRPR